MHPVCFLSSGFVHYPCQIPYFTAAFQEGPLTFLSRTFISSLVLAGLALSSVAQQTQGHPERQSPATVETSEALFALMSAINNCGYNDDLAGSLPVRSEVRQELAGILQQNADAAQAQGEVCAYYRDHQPGDTSRTISQYISLGLLMNDLPQFSTRIRESDLPPDAAYAVGILSPLQRMYEAGNVHALWLRHRRQYDALVEQYHEPLRKMISDTDLYLRLPMSGFSGRTFTVYLEPMIGPSITNSRNYNVEYYFVGSPDGTNLKIEKIRHTYLHFLLDPLTQHRANQLARMEPILTAVQDAPMDRSFKMDIALLTVESLIQAVEIRTLPYAKGEEGKREAAVQSAVAQGYVLTRYFFNRLATFEKSEIGLELSFGNWLHDMDVDHQRKEALETKFASVSTTPEIVTIARPIPQGTLLNQAEQSLLKGDLDGAAKIAQEVLNGSTEDHGKAYFVLARISVLRAVGDVATKQKEMTDAKDFFFRSLELSTDPRTKAWCHIYLGRIFDLQDDRENALRHYNAALAQGDKKADTTAAAERGMKTPYKIQTKRD